MSTCWSHDPNSRPSANQIIELAEWAEFTQLGDTLAMPECHKVTAAVAVPPIPPMLQQSKWFWKLRIPYLTLFI